eukprot:scaffold2908_cov257-Pinguiococcus_pyrenoidosus.AAC.32
MLPTRRTLLAPTISTVAKAARQGGSKRSRYKSQQISPDLTVNKARAGKRLRTETEKNLSREHLFVGNQDAAFARQLASQQSGEVVNEEKLQDDAPVTAASAASTSEASKNSTKTWFKNPLGPAPSLGGPPSAPPPSGPPPSFSSLGLAQGGTPVLGHAGRSAPPSSSQTSANRLVEMGFDRAAVDRALAANNGDEQAALNSLLA